MERLPSGLRRRSRKAVLPKGDVGSNPTLSAMHHALNHVRFRIRPELHVVQDRVHGKPENLQSKFYLKLLTCSLRPHSEGLRVFRLKYLAFGENYEALNL